jgi:group I intron endonuclease
MGVIYILENKINGKFYVGQTVQKFKYRFRSHQISHSILGNALRKYGVNKFNIILLENIPEDKLDELEKEYIQKYNSLYPNGYNFQSGGQSSHHLHKETKKRMSEDRKGKPSNRKGIHLTEETKKKMSESQKGKNISKEQCIKISESKMGIPQKKITCPFCGKIGGNAMHRWHFNNCREYDASENEYRLG